MDDQTLNAILGFSPQPEDKGVTGHVMDFLSAINAPNRALYGGLMNAVNGTGPDETFWQGMKQGWNDQSDYALPDLFGLHKGTSEDTWGPWLAKEIPYLALSALGDPLTWAFTPARAGGIVGNVLKGAGLSEGKSIAGLASEAAGLPRVTDYLADVTGLGKAFRHGTGSEEMDLVHAGLNRQLGETRQFTEQQAQDIVGKLAEMGLTPERNPEIYHALEWGAGELPNDISPEVLDFFKPLRDKLQELFTAENELRLGKNLNAIPNISGNGYSYMPRFRIDTPTKEMVSRGLGYAEPESRNIFRYKYADEPGGLAMNPETGVPLVSQEKEAFLKKAGIVKDPQTGGWIEEATGRPLETTPQVGLKDILDANIGLTGEHFITDPAEALKGSILAAQKRVNFLQQIEEGEKAKLLGDLAHAPDNWRALNIPGLKEFAAEPKYADFLENQARAAFDRSTPIGAVGDVLARFNDSYLGEKLKGLTNFWKGTVLSLHPGWHAGNFASNQIQEMMPVGGEAVRPWMVPIRDLQALATQRGWSDTVPGIDVLKEAQIRDLAGSGLFGSTGKETANGLLNTIENLPGGKAISMPAKALDKAQQGGFWFGGKLEDNSKLAVFIDQLKKLLPENYQTMPKDELAAVIDKAAMNAHSALIDYGPSGGWTALEKELMSIVPFYKWQRGIAGRTADVLTHSPQSLSGLSRGLDAFLTPMAPGDKNIMDQWAKEQAPIQGIAGGTWEPDERGYPQMALAGRFLPHGNVEQFLKRPWDFLESIINPAIKTPLELMTNYSSFKDRPIDELAGSFPYNLTAPVTGGPYQGASEQMFGHTLPAAYDYLLTQLPGARYLREVNEAGRAAGLWEDKYKDVNPDFNTFVSWYLTGGKQYPFDRSAAYMRRQKEQDKIDSAIRHDLNYATAKGDTDRVQRDIEMTQDQQLRKWVALGMVEPGQ